MPESDFIDLPTIEIEEGKAHLIVPDPGIFRVARDEYSPSKTPVFFNPYMHDNRNIMVAVLLALAKESSHSLNFAESMGGIGVRTVRALLEAQMEGAFYNDVNPTAVHIAARNLDRNGLSSKATVCCAEANIFQAFHSRGSERVSYLDLDPFGSPASHMFTAISAIQHGGLLGMTSTDTAVLNGVFPRKCLARYGAWIEKVHIMRELGIRVLLGTLSRFAAAQEVGIVPLMSYCDRHYVRTYVKVLRGGRQSRSSASNLGMLRYDRTDMSWSIETFGKFPKSVVTMGPIWTGRYQDKRFLRNVMEEATRASVCSRSMERMGVMLDELDSFGYLCISALAEKAKTSPVATHTIISRLRSLGYEATRTSFGADCIKTNMPSEKHLSFFKTSSKA